MICATFRMKDVKIFSAIVISILMVIILLFITYRNITKDVINLHTYNDRIEYLESLEISTENIVETSKDITIPTQFNEIYEEYSKEQIEKGFPDLHTFQGDTATTYNYTLNDGSIVQLLVCDGILVGTSLS